MSLELQRAVAEYGTVHILVNNAGTAGKMSSHDNVNVESFRRTWEIATLGSIMLISAVYPIMEQQHYGRIINTSSDSMIGMGAGEDGGTRQYFETHLVADFVVALATEACPVSGELFSVGGGRAARATFAPVPRHAKETTPDAYLNNFEQVMEKTEDLFVPADVLDLVSYAIKHATGEDLGKINL
ncbi:unnamed protein product [Clonostachys rosea]|uniref:Uncharacterized protein n=1 Tax=Bionectria ochroleuca TaxID=29856 RepID=A0ABY6V261_BIOOC|nr:unnamed protein product [Clonostachys rosea]